MAIVMITLMVMNTTTMPLKIFLICMVALEESLLVLVAVVKVALVVLVVLVGHIVPIFLRIFLETLAVEEEEVLEDVIQIIEGQI